MGLGLVSETSTKPPSEIAKRDEWWVGGMYSQAEVVLRALGHQSFSGQRTRVPDKLGVYTGCGWEMLSYRSENVDNTTYTHTTNGQER